MFVASNRGWVFALNADTAILTAWANDAGYETVFSRQVEALGRPGDILLGVSTSGRSANLLRAFGLKWKSPRSIYEDRSPAIL